MLSNTFTLDEVRRPEFWRNLQPDLSIESTQSPPVFDSAHSENLLHALRAEGYVNVPDVISENDVARLRQCVQCLHERKIPLPFAFVYDEFWHCFQGLSPFLEAVLGESYRVMPDFWVWFVVPAENGAGWAPHRDRLRATVNADNSPQSLTVWLALSDTTPLNGCIYVLPAHLDPRFKRRVWDGADNNIVEEPQNIRALPATAGSVLAWNQNLLHWGGRASQLATNPRCSMSFEFQRADVPPFNTPLLDPHTIPSFHYRLALVAKQILQYKHMYPLSADVAAIANQLRV